MFTASSSKGLALTSCQYAPVQQDEEVCDHSCDVEEGSQVQDILVERQSLWQHLRGRGCSCAELRVLGSAVLGVLVVFCIAAGQRLSLFGFRRADQAPTSIVGLSEDVVLRADLGSKVRPLTAGSTRTSTTTWLGILPPLHCVNYICTDGYSLKHDGPAYCGGHTCTRAQCCFPLGHCVDYTCVNSTKRHAPTTLYYPWTCAHQLCTEYECCNVGLPPAPTKPPGACAAQFNASRCSSEAKGAELKKDINGTCHEDECTAKECCDDESSMNTAAKVAAGAIGASVAAEHIAGRLNDKPGGRPGARRLSAGKKGAGNKQEHHDHKKHAEEAAKKKAKEKPVCGTYMIVEPDGTKKREVELGHKEYPYARTLMHTFSGKMVSPHHTDMVVRFKKAFRLRIQGCSYLFHDSHPRRDVQGDNFAGTKSEYHDGRDIHVSRDKGKQSTGVLSRTMSSSSAAMSLHKHMSKHMGRSTTWKSLVPHHVTSTHVEIERISNKAIAMKGLPDANGAPTKEPVTLERKEPHPMLRHLPPILMLTVCALFFLWDPDTDKSTPWILLYTTLGGMILPFFIDMCPCIAPILELVENGPACMAGICCFFPVWDAIGLLTRLVPCVPALMCGSLSGAITAAVNGASSLIGLFEPFELLEMMMKGITGFGLAIMSAWTLITMGTITEKEFSNFLTASLMLLAGVGKWVEHAMDHFTHDVADKAAGSLDEAPKSFGINKAMAPLLRGDFMGFSSGQFKISTMKFVEDTSRTTLTSKFESLKEYVNQANAKITQGVAAHIDTGLDGAHKMASEQLSRSGSAASLTRSLSSSASSLGSHTGEQVGGLKKMFDGHSSKIKDHCAKCKGNITVAKTNLEQFDTALSSLEKIVAVGTTDLNPIEDARNMIAKTKGIAEQAKQDIAKARTSVPPDKEAERRARRKVMVIVSKVSIVHRRLEQVPNVSPTGCCQSFRERFCGAKPAAEMARQPRVQKTFDMPSDMLQRLKPQQMDSLLQQALDGLADADATCRDMEGLKTSDFAKNLVQKIESILEGTFEEQMEQMHTQHSNIKSSVAVARQLHDMMKEVVTQADDVITRFDAKVAEFQKGVRIGIKNFENHLTGAGESGFVSNQLSAHKAQVKQSLMNPLITLLAETKEVISEQMIDSMANICMDFAEGLFDDAGI